jgi:hypothetical protein
LFKVVLDKLVYPAAEHATDSSILLDVKELVFSSRTAKVSGKTLTYLGVAQSRTLL